MTAVDIDNAESAHAQTHRTIQINPFIVWTTVHNHIAHPSEDPRIYSLIEVTIENARNTTHCALP